MQLARALRAMLAMAKSRLASKPLPLVAYIPGAKMPCISKRCGVFFSTAIPTTDGVLSVERAVERPSRGY